jgi:hypothetical protein
MGKMLKQVQHDGRANESKGLSKSREGLELRELRLLIIEI